MTTLRERLLAEAPYLGRYGTEGVEQAVAEWLRESADVYKGSPERSEREIRYELLALAERVADGTT